MSDIDDLLEAAEPNPLLARVDALAGGRDWDGLVQLATRCRQAVERGKQLWPIAEHIDYRLALEAPGAYAAAVLQPDAGRFALGPLTEVAASTHSFGELADHILSQQTTGFVAAERVVRGEDLRSVPGTYQETLEMPLVLSDWEPAYPLAVYRASKAVFPDPDIQSQLTTGTPEPFEVIDDEESRVALMGLVDVWVSQSNGTVEVSTVEGLAGGAVTALGYEEFTTARVSAAEALAMMAWAAASGGAHGKRRGAAFGRFAAWWTGATLSDVEWPPDPSRLGDAISQLDWFLWRPAGGLQGWNLHLAVASSEGWAAAIAASDHVDDS
jgi:hypothetical protein